MGSRTNNSKDQFPKWVIIISENWHKTWIWTFEKGDSFCFLNPHFSGFMLVYEFSGGTYYPNIIISKKKQRTEHLTPWRIHGTKGIIYLLIYLTTSTIHVGTPGKINLEPENGGLEDDFPVQFGEFWCLFRFHANFQGCTDGWYDTTIPGPVNQASELSAPAWTRATKS